MLSCYCKGGEDMQIQPNSIIKLCSGVPIDSSYKDTIYFASRSAQKTYFDSKVSRTMEKASFQRINGQQGVVRMNASAESIYNCNYMMFQNSNYGTKWFYAFITNIEYVNDKVSNVYFTIDVMQTWFLFDCTLKESFVEREHSVTDNVGDNIIGENLELGEYSYGNKHNTGLFDEWGILVQSPYNINQKYSGGNKYEGVSSGCVAFLLYDNVFQQGQDKEKELATWLAGMNEKGYTDSIVSISMFPKKFGPTDGTINMPNTAIRKNFSITKPAQNGNYIPRNKKLLTAPFCMIGMSDGGSQIANYKYEFFTNTDEYCHFDVDCDPNTLTFVCTPINYNGGINANQNALTMDNLPLCSFDSDTFKIWWAQNKVTMTSSIKRTISNAGSLAILNPATAPLGEIKVVDKIKESVAEYKQHELLPNYVKGNAGSGVGIVRSTQDFYYFQIHLKEQYARVIDDYFDLYGYATKRVKTPNISSRPHWNYTKTIGCNVVSVNCNNNDVTAIKNIFDNGITFWKNADEIGNYSLDNSPS